MASLTSSSQSLEGEKIAAVDFVAGQPALLNLDPLILDDSVVCRSRHPEVMKRC
jgi:hypothetical protein